MHPIMFCKDEDGGGIIGGDGVHQDAFEPENIDSDATEGCDVPFDPKLVQVFPRTLVIDLLMRRIRTNTLDLHPDFQRNSGVWTRTKQSRLVESLLIRIPLPSFYFDASQEDKWVVVDGLQRLSVIWNFVNNRFKLTNLEFLHGFEGLTYAELPSVYQLRIDETEVLSYLIMPQTPRIVKFNIFRRINTGGVPLSAQEMRQALYLGPCTEVLKTMAESNEFRQATSGKISALRMADRECALRYLAFLEADPTAYVRKDFNLFLCEFMEDFNARHKGRVLPDPDLKKIVDRFRDVMAFAFDLFGNRAFRKMPDVTGRFVPVNKALFEAWSVNLARLSKRDGRLLLERREVLARANRHALTKDIDFIVSITQGTGDVANVRKRFAKVSEIIREVIHD